MKTSRQRKRRSAPGDVAPPGQQYSDRECIRWLLEFLRCDLAALRPGELLDLRNEVFPYLHYKSRATVTVVHEDELLAHGPVPPRRPGVDARQVIAAARTFMGGLQDDLRAGVNALQAGMWHPFGRQGPAPSWSLERGDDGAIVRAYMGGAARNHTRVSRRRVGAMVAGTPALQTRALRHVVSADARASVLSRRPVCVGGPVSTIQADAGLQSRIRAPIRQHTHARSAPPIRKDEAALTRGSAVDRRAGRRSGPPAGTERLRRVRLHGTSESEWDMEGR